MRRSTKGKKSKSSGDNEVNDKEELGSKGGDAVAVSGEENSDDDNLSLQLQKNKRGKRGENHLPKSNDADTDVSDAKKRKKNSVPEKEVEEEYEVEEVVDSKLVRGARHFKIHWKGFGPESDTWEPEKDLNCPELIQAFLDKNPNATTKDSKTTKKGGKSGSVDKAKKKKTEEDGESEETVYEVELVTDSKVSRGTRQFKIRWKGFGPESDTWEPEKDLNCSELIQAYLKKNPDASNKNAKGGGKSSSSRDKTKKNKQSEEDEENEETVYEVEKVMEVHFKKNGNREFLIHWKGFSHNDDTWEPEANLSCPELIEKFMSKEDKGKPSSVKDVKATPQKKAQSGRRPSRKSDVK